MSSDGKHLKKHQFKPGQSGNPDGARKHNPVLKALKQLTVESYREVIQLVLTGNIAMLEELIDDFDTPAIQVGVAKCFLKALNAGDYTTIRQIAEHVIGKIPDELKVTATNLNANLNATVDQTKVKAALEALELEV